MAAFLACLTLIQLVIYFRTTLEATFLHPQVSFFQQHSNSQNHHHPSVLLTLKQYALLDQLTESIVQAETHRVFGESGRASLHGTPIQNDTLKVKRIRNQIDCWTLHGTWVRQDGLVDKSLSKTSHTAIETAAFTNTTTPWAARKHLGDARFGVCDVRFMEALDRLESDSEGEQHVLGDHDHQHNRWIVREAVKYRWIPDEKMCGPTAQNTGGTDSEEGGSTSTLGLEHEPQMFQPFDTQAFCKVVGKRHVLVVGDLTQYQLHDALLSAMDRPFSCSGEMSCLARTNAHVLCEGASNLTFARNDILSVPWAVDPELDERFEAPSQSTCAFAWATPQLLETYSIVFLNRGLFWREDGEFLQQLVFTMKHLWTFYPDTMILYRATHPVSNCTTYKDDGEDGAIPVEGAVAGADSLVPETVVHVPLTTPPTRRVQMQGSTTQTVVYRPTLADVQRQNRMAKAVVEAAGGIFLDTENMFAMRPDGRVGDGDCARFCAPGPLDVYSDLIFNTLRILQT
ncbi:hypothetical protein BGZ70_003655 [Mortierella alpina]|uniref:Uncharacterized protein n=1 Tax=Mortierella alpina TaxID=64518 RepID=A0A9P6JAM5_MORAP|nr:hypothetical protein BGZ70_003655 [Mortierella alpina]